MRSIIGNTHTNAMKFGIANKMVSAIQIYKGDIPCLNNEVFYMTQMRHHPADFEEILFEKPQNMLSSASSPVVKYRTTTFKVLIKEPPDKTDILLKSFMKNISTINLPLNIIYVINHGRITLYF
ncbi:MAG: hypothetical protein ABIA63_10265 [bacterium]